MCFHHLCKGTVAYYKLFCLENEWLSYSIVCRGDTVFLSSALFGTDQYDLIGGSQGNPSPFEVQWQSFLFKKAGSGFWLTHTLCCLM